MLKAKEVVEIIQSRGLAIQRLRGQNFLIDENVVRKMIRLSHFSPVDIVVEIGAGLGNLTEDIAKEVRQIFALEIDDGFCDYLTERFSAPCLTIPQLIEEGGQVLGPIVILRGDALDLDPGVVADEKRGVVVFGNLPYCETSPILIHLLECRKCIDRMLVLLQKEVADRLIAKPGAKEKAYSKLSVIIQTYFEPSVLMEMGPTVFLPKPDVRSTFLSLKRRSAPFADLGQTPPDGFEEFLPKVIAQAFSKRRKMLRTLLPEGWPTIPVETWAGIFAETRIDSTRRGESLSLEEFHQLTLVLQREKDGVRTL